MRARVKEGEGASVRGPTAQPLGGYYHHAPKGAILHVQVWGVSIHDKDGGAPAVWGASPGHGQDTCVWTRVWGRPTSVGEATGRGKESWDWGQPLYSGASRRKWGAPLWVATAED